MTVIQRCRHRHIHTEIDREKRGHVDQNVEKCYSTRPHQHLHRLYTEQLQGVAFWIGHNMTGPQDLCNQIYTKTLGSAVPIASYISIRKSWTLRLREIFHSLLSMMGGRIIRWKEKSKKGIWCDIQSPHLLDYALWEGHQTKEHKPFHVSFLASSTLGSFGS